MTEFSIRKGGFFSAIITEKVPTSAGQPFSFRRRRLDKAHRRQAAFHSDNGNRLLHGRFPIRVWLIMLSFILFLP